MMPNWKDDAMMIGAGFIIGLMFMLAIVPT